MKDQLDNINDAKSMLDNAEVIHNSRPPLRWIANLAGRIGSSGLLDVSYMEDAGYTGWRYKYNLFLWNIFYPFYNKYGTYYKLNFDDSFLDEDFNPHLDFDPLECLCKNCDEDKHCSGCMDCDNDFIDEETGDAFRVIRRDDGNM